MKQSNFSLAILILALLVSSTSFAASAADPRSPEELKKILDAPPPDPKEHSKAALTKIYMERGRAASALGDLDRELKELDAGIQAVGAKDPNAYDFYNRRAPLDLDRGDYVSARAARELALEVAGSAGRQFFQLNYLSSISAVLRDRDSAKTYLSRADSLLSSVRRSNPDWGRFGNFWQAALSESKGNYNLSFGYLIEAQSHYRTCTTAIRSYMGKNPNPADNSYYYLPQCLGRSVELAARLGYLREAGAYVNDVRETAKAYAQAHQRVLFETRMARPITRVYLEQGLLTEAKELIESTISRSEKFQQGEASLQVGAARLFAAQLEMIQGNWLKAEEHFRARRDGLRANKAQSEEIDTENTPDWGYALLRLGKTQEAMIVLNAGVSATKPKTIRRAITLPMGKPSLPRTR